MPSLSLKPQLTAGIRNNFRTGRNQAGLVSLVNAHVDGGELYPYEPLLNPISLAADAGVPAVLVFRGPTYIVAFGNDDKVYTLADGQTDWAETEITTFINPDDLDATLSLNASDNMWQFAAFQKGWIATNGVCALYSVSGVGVYLDNITHPLCVCSFRGRIFYGGLASHWSRFNSRGYALDMWGQTLEQMTDAWIGWCTIQGRDILQHVFPGRAISAGIGTVETELTENGDFNDTSTGWTAGAGWTYTAGPGRMVAAAADGNLDYAVTTAMVPDSADTFRLEVDMARTSGSVAVSIVPVSPSITVEYIGDLTLDSSGNHYLYFRISSPSFAFAVRLDGVAFTGTVYRISVKRSPHFDKFTTWEEEARLLQSGFSPAADQGDVLCIKALHDHVVVYGDNFIAAYSPVSVPSPTFGKVSIASFGIAGRLAVGGDLKRHVLCDTTGKLWGLNNDLSLQALGFEELFRDAIVYGGSPVVVNYDDNSGATYVSLENASGNTTYLLDAGGTMSQVRTELVHSVVGTRGSATWADTTGYATDGDSDEFRMLTDALDFGIPGFKTVKSVRVLGEGVETLSVMVQFRAAGDASWRSGAAQTCNAMGDVDPEQSGFEFRFLLTAPDFTAVRLYDIVVTFETAERMNAKSVITRR